MKMKITNPKDFWSGLGFAAIGVLFAGIAYTYKLGTAARMGPGFFPFWLGLLLIVLGAVVCIGGIRTKGGPLETFHWKPVITVLSAIVLFGLFFKVTGMLFAGVFLVVFSSLASGEYKSREIVPLGIGLVIFCAMVFVWGLKLPIPLCPGFEYFEQFKMCRG
jgi:hypothetical protein